MRPGRAPEGQQQVRRPALGIAEPVRRAQLEPRLAHAVVAPSPQSLGQRQRGQYLALLVEQDAFRLPLDRRDASATIRQFGDPRRPGDTLQVTVDQLRFGRPPDPAPRDDVEKDQTLAASWTGAGALDAIGSGAAAGASPNDHIRSRL